MTCHELKPLLDGYFDGELDLVRQIELEKHLEGCSGCSSELQSRRTLRNTIRSANLSKQAPKMLHQWAMTQEQPKEKVIPKSSPWNALKGWSGGFAIISLAMIYLGNGLIVRRTEKNRLAEEIVSAHVRSLMAAHLTDVSSSNQHTVKPWFNGKIDFAPSVKNLAEFSFPLVGGRMDYVGERPVAALVYQRGRHYINVFLWPKDKERDEPSHSLYQRGYSLVTWTSSGLTYWVISDLNRHDLEEFSRLMES